jgi:hypothetical protein
MPNAPKVPPRITFALYAPMLVGKRVTGLHRAERSHPFPLIPISYELPLGCHSRGQM